MNVSKIPNMKLLKIYPVGFLLLNAGTWMDRYKRITVACHNILQICLKMDAKQNKVNDK